MLTPEGVVKLIDFGTIQVSGLQDINSKLTEDVPVGTAEYMAPEYLQGQKISLHGNTAVRLICARICRCG